jgi:hypothetical protein
VIKGPENKPAGKGKKPILPWRRAGRIGKKVIVSKEESEEVPLQVNGGKGDPRRPENMAMLGLKNPKTRSDCDPGLEAEMRLLGCLDEEEEQQPWDDLPINADEHLEAPFCLGLGAQGAKPEDKLQALLQEKVEKEKEKKKKSPPKGEGSGKEIQWHEGLAQRKATLAEVTAGENVVNPQAQPFDAEGEEKGEEVASPSMRVRATNQDMVDALLESPRGREVEAPAPLVQNGGRKEAKKSKKSGDPQKERKKARRAEQAKRAEAASKETEWRSEQESSTAVVSEHASKELAGPEEGRAMEINGLEKERVSGQRGQKPAETQLHPQPEPIQQKPPQALDQNPASKLESEKPAASPNKSPAPKLATVPEETAQNQQPDSPKGEAQALLNSPPPTKPESVPANPLTNLALAQTAPAKASDQSTQTDFDRPKSTEESWEVTFLANGYVRVEITVRESNGRLRPSAEHMMPEEEFFEKPWVECCGFFRFQQGQIPDALQQLNAPSQNPGKGKRYYRVKVFNCRSCND